MVATSVLEADAERRVSSSLTPGTKNIVSWLRGLRQRFAKPSIQVILESVSSNLTLTAKF